ncbi:hypothetical protein [Amycolatopsis sp. CA-230715]|uniref:hypothetical protein n=1 Tax=Amycolatopsis sp. CA-230715 TaxID=2745196 RepID=UPI001C00EAB3|nr:hypothetical protein [Amycolatopsis sp. CA-230715]
MTASASLSGRFASSAVRTAVRTVLAGASPGDVRAATKLVEELVADARRGGATLRSVELARATSPPSLRVLVQRTEAGTATGEPLTPEITEGRFVVEEIATAWGTQTHRDTTTTWAALTLRRRGN